MSSNQKALPLLSGVATSIIFGLSFLFSKKALAIVDPFTLLSFRFLTAFIVMSVLILFRVIKVNFSGKPVKNIFYLSLMQPITYFVFETFGIKFSSSSQAGLMIALIPIVVTILSSYILKEKSTKAQAFFIILSVAGVAIIVLMNGSASNVGTLLGTILLLGAVFSGAIFSILSRKYSAEFTPMELTYGMMGLGMIFFNTISIINHLLNKNMGNYLTPLANKDFLFALVYLGILSSIIAFFLTNFQLSKIEASKSAVFANLSTVVSIIAGVILLHENFQYYHLIGSVMILIGVWGTNYFGIKKKTINEIDSIISL